MDETVQRMIDWEPVILVDKDVDPEYLCFTIPKVSDLLKISPSTLRGWISRQQFPPADGKVDDRTPYWRLTTVIEYVRNAPGGRLGYPVG